MYVCVVQEEAYDEDSEGGGAGQGMVLQHEDEYGIGFGLYHS